MLKASYTSGLTRAGAEQYSSELQQYKKDQEMKAALATQELEFAKRTAADSQVLRLY